MNSNEATLQKNYFHVFVNFNLSVIRQKGESQNGCFKENKARQTF